MKICLTNKLHFVFIGNEKYFVHIERSFFLNVYFIPCGFLWRSETLGFKLQHCSNLWTNYFQKVWTWFVWTERLVRWMNIFTTVLDWTWINCKFIKSKKIVLSTRSSHLLSQRLSSKMSTKQFWHFRMFLHLPPVYLYYFSPLWLTNSKLFSKKNLLESSL